MCGIFGGIGNCSVQHDVLEGILAEKHRGTETATYYSFPRGSSSKKVPGTAVDLVTQIRRQVPVEVEGAWVRYRTQGSVGLENAQPFINKQEAIALFENGQVKNMKSLTNYLSEKGLFPQSTSDAELLLMLFANSFEHSTGAIPDRVHAAVQETQTRAIGGYSCVVLMKDIGLLGFKDPHSIRPLSFGEKRYNGTRQFAFASETKALEKVGYNNVRELANGESVLVQNDLSVSSKILVQRNAARCYKEIAYFSRSDSLFDNIPIENHREKLGELLTERISHEVLQRIDQVTPIPNSGKWSALGVAKASGKPYIRAITKVDDDVRTFLRTTQEERRMQAKKVLAYTPHEIEGRRLLLVDDTLVGGTVIQEVIGTLYRLGAQEVHVAIASPPTRYDCDNYGMDIKHKSDRPLIAKNIIAEEIRQKIKASSLTYLEMDDVYNVLGPNLCVGCLTGEYPTAPWDEP